MHTNADLKIFLCVCVYTKQYLENFAFLIPIILELFARELCKFPKEQAKEQANKFYCF